MASKEDISEQLAMTQKLAAQVERMAAAAERIKESYTDQINIMTKLASVMGTVNPQDAARKVEVLNKALQDMKERAQESGKASEQTFQKLGKVIEDTGKTYKDKFPRSVAFATGALNGFITGIRNMVGLSKSITGFFGGLLDGVTGVAASIISFPFKFFEALIDFAAKAGGGSSELAQAIEDLRKQFGALYGPTNHAIVTLSKNMTGFKDTGLSTWRVFGDLAKRLKDLRELATEMGGTFGPLRKSFEDNGGAILAYQKGLGLSNEEMKGMASRAIAMDEDVTVALKDMTKQSYALGNAFGVDAKLISRDMGKAMTDVKHFGGAAVKQIAEAATYARKLGFELKDITGTLDAFSTFDQAAENVAKLSQTFGVNIDQMKLMNAQDPATIVDELRRSFRAAGVDASNFNRAQLKLVAGVTGLDEAAVKQGLSMKNQGMRMDEIQKKSSEAEKKTLTQAEAMKTLADAIERLVFSGGQQTGSFWDMFVKGFLGGLQATKEFSSMIWNIKRSLQITYMEGVRLGKLFVDIFPGVKEFFSGVADFFKPEKFRKMVGGVVDVLEEWMKGLTATGGKGSFTVLMQKLQEKFFNFFDMEKPASKQMIDGFKTFFKTFTNVVSEGIKWASEKVAEGITWITDLISGRVALPGVGMAAEGLGFFGQALLPLLDALAHAYKTIKPVLWELLKTVGGIIKDFLTSDEFINTVKPAIRPMLMVLFGPAFVQAMIGAMVGAATKGVGGFLAGGGKKIVEGLVSKTQEVAESAKKVTGSGGATKNDIRLMQEKNKYIDKLMEQDRQSGWGAKDAVKLGLKLLAIAAALAGGGVLMAMSFIAIKGILKLGGIHKPEDALAPMMVLGSMVLASVPLMFALKQVNQIGNISEILKGGLLLSAAVGIVGITGALLVGLMSKVSKPAEMDAAGTLMLKMSLVFLAMVPLIAASMVIGALATGPQAILLGSAAIGLGVIGAAVAEMTGVALGIVEALRKMQIDTSFQQKIDAFLGIMRSIQAFTDTLVRIIELMQPTLIGFLTKTEQKFTDKITAASDAIKSMVGEKGKGGIIGMIDVVMNVVRQMNYGGPKMAAAAQTVATLIQATSEMLKAMTPSDAFFEASTNFWMKFRDRTYDISTVSRGVGQYASNLREQLMIMLKGEAGKGGLISLINDMANVNIPDVAKAKEVANIITSIANITKALTPDGETLKAMQESGTKISYFMMSLYDSKKNAVKTDDIIKLMSEKARGVESIVKAISEGPLKSIIDANIPKEKLEGMKVIIDMMKIVTDLAIGIASSTPKGNITIPKEAHDVVINLVPDVNRVLMAMQSNLSGLFNNLIGLVKLAGPLASDKTFMKNLDVVKSLFSIVGEIPKLSDAVRSENSGTTMNTDVLVGAVAAAGIFFGRLMSGAAFGTSRPPLIELIENVDEINKVFATKQIGGLDKTIAHLKKVMLNIGEMGNAFADSMSIVEKAVPQIEAGAMHPALKAVQMMVETSNMMNDALANSALNKLDVSANLKKVASAVGLGGKATYTVNPSKEVQITVNLHVTMDAGTVERVIIERTNSIIRDRINFATSSPSSTGDSTISDTYGTTPKEIHSKGSEP